MSDFEGLIDVPGGRLWAQWAGEGSAVVLVHAGIADARMWDPQWDTLVSQHRAARPNTWSASPPVRSTRQKQFSNASNKRFNSWRLNGLL